MSDIRLRIGRVTLVGAPAGGPGQALLRRRLAASIERGIRAALESPGSGAAPDAARARWPGRVARVVAGSIVAQVSRPGRRPGRVV